MRSEGSIHFDGGVYVNGGPFYIFGNNISDNKFYGIEFYWNATMAFVYNNNIVSNEIGISLPAMPSNISGSGNKIYQNNIVDNGKNAFVEPISKYGNNNSTDTVSWDNGYLGNYWSDYNGYGSYVIDENNVDYYPLTQPVDISPVTPTPIDSSNRWILQLAIPIIAAAILTVVIISALLFRRHRKTISQNKPYV